MPRRPSATVVLRPMGFITSLDRVTVAAAGAGTIEDLGTSNTRSGPILPAFADPSAILQGIGGPRRQRSARGARSWPAA